MALVWVREYEDGETIIGTEADDGTSTINWTDTDGEVVSAFVYPPSYLRRRIGATLVGQQPRPHPDGNAYDYVTGG